MLTEVLRGGIFPVTPLIAPLRSGRTNMCALDLGSTRNPVRAMEKLLAAAAENRVEPLVVERHVLRVAFEPDGVVEYARVCGVGRIIARFSSGTRAFPRVAARACSVPAS